MHPDLITALARQRQADLRHEYQFRDLDGNAVDHEAARAGRPLVQVRRSLGSALVLMGTRLLPPGHPAADWALTSGRDAVMR
ncbi:MAG: hypothetical protein ACRDY1_02465 [Acidimicrobiales bacterium]